jgi:hypothetical protein
VLKRHDKLEDLSDGELRTCARLVARQANLRSSLNGKDGADFVQEALRKVLAGERNLDPTLSLHENVVRIALSMVWSERQKRSERPFPAVRNPDPCSRDLDPDAVADLYEALQDATSALESLVSKGGVYQDAALFVACLAHQIAERKSVKPGHIAKLLGMKQERAYAAWRKVKSVLRRELERTRP